MYDEMIKFSGGLVWAPKPPPYHHTRKFPRRVRDWGGWKYLNDGIIYYMNEHNQDIAYSCIGGGVMIHPQPRDWGKDALKQSTVKLSHE